MNADEDLDDIESRLYSHVYHGTSDPSDENNADLNETDNSVAWKKRYFSQRPPRNYLQTPFAITNLTINNIQDNVLHNQPSDIHSNLIHSNDGLGSFERDDTSPYNACLTPDKQNRKNKKRKLRTNDNALPHERNQATENNDCAIREDNNVPSSAECSNKIIENSVLKNTLPTEDINIAKNSANNNSDSNWEATNNRSQNISTCTSIFAMDILNGPTKQRDSEFIFYDQREIIQLRKPPEYCRTENNPSPNKSVNDSNENAVTPNRQEVVVYENSLDSNNSTAEKRKKKKKAKKPPTILTRQEVINEVSKRLQLNSKQTARVPPETEVTHTRFDVDEEVIFVPPPPVEVINLEDSFEKNQLDSPTKDSPHIENPDATLSNDFLDNSNIETNSTNFNFSLHGSEFRDGQSDVVPMQKSTEYCETESSCSTNEHHSKNFSNTVKTIVFDEVEFPKEDIFSGKNLESFSSFITPKRKCSMSKESEQPSSSTNDKVDFDYSSDSSSSESDYGGKVNKKTNNLPHLSSIVPVTVLSKPVVNIDEEQTMRMTSRTLPFDYPNESDISLNVLEDNCPTSTPIKPKKKKKPSTEPSTKDPEKTLNDSESEKPKKKKKKRTSMTENSDVTIEQTTNTDSQSTTLNVEEENSKNKKKKRQNSDVNATIEPTEVNHENSISDFINNLQLTTDLSRNIGMETNRRSKPSDSNDDKDADNKKKKPIKNTPITTTSIKPQCVVESSANEVEEEPIVIIADDSLDDHIVLSSDSESDIAIFDDVGNDLSFNYSTDEAKHQDNLSSIASRFDVATIQNQQSDDPQKWLISHKDRMILLNMKTGPRCRRCRQQGHFGLKCPDKPFPKPCILCGSLSHQEPRCPNKMCLQCGNPGSYSTTYCNSCFKFRNLLCNICRMYGHVQKFCPDLWRRYHKTKIGPIVPSSETVKSKEQLWCSGCAKQGHLEHECLRHIREFPPTTPFVMSYVDVLNSPQNANCSMELESDSAPISSPSVNVSNVMISPQLSDNSFHLSPNNGEDLANSGANMTIHVPNDSASTNLFLQMMVNFNNQPNTQCDARSHRYKNVDLSNMNEVKNFIMSRPLREVYNFISDEMYSIKTCNVDLNVLRAKLNKYNNIRKRKAQLPPNINKEANFWYRTINMYLFGFKQMKDGGLHVRYLRNFLIKSKNNPIIPEAMRMALFCAYSYIFATTPHPQINYKSLMNAPYKNKLQKRR
ncbi:unnamed protein product [Phyllotreta striolata]|uniref:Zinc finger CCHC domain-containing protein 7 n=1 Tax=Phyllotreta striolata TaxID=444603 RepID=A0A9N9TKZ0_PHYSR|nr:unnamed protein product [Phyllotreta striolata]